MRYKIDDIGPEGREVKVPVTEQFVAAECPSIDGKPSARGLTLQGSLIRAGDDVLLRGALKGGIVTACARCLDPATVPYDVPIMVSFVELKRGADEPEPDDSKDTERIGFSGGVIDLTVELRDEILLAMPVRALCREECLGLCSVCGGNRNVVACECEAKQRVASAKLAALGDLKLS